MGDDQAESTVAKTPGGTVGAYWDSVIDDMAATAERLEGRDWETVSLHPGDVTPLVGEEVDVPGFDVLLPDDEWETLLDVLERSSLDECDVYSTTVEDTQFCVIVMQDATAEMAVLFPIFFDRGGDDADDLRERVEADGMVRTRLRRLRNDRFVTFEIDEPALVFPEIDG